MKRDLYVTSQRGHVSSVKADFELPETLVAPLAKNKPIGKAKVVVDGTDDRDVRPLPDRGRAGRRLLRPRLGQPAAAVPLTEQPWPTRIPTCWLNGEYLPLAEARISPLDRGFLFADGAYEVVPVHRGRPFRMRQHLERLDRSLVRIRDRAIRCRCEQLGRCDEQARRARATPPSCSSTCR